MAKRSLKASTAGIQRAKQAFERRAWTQEYLASAVGLQTRQSVWKFFSGRPIERHLFIDICFQLDLDWEDIADLPKFEPIVPDPSASSNYSENSSPILASQLPGSSPAEQEQWLEQVRSQVASAIQNQCGVVPAALDLEQPLPLSQIYTEINLFEHLSSHRWLELADLQTATGKRFTASELDETACSARDNFQSRQPERAMTPALEAIHHYNKLAIFGKPGSGKTTFLQHLALLYSQTQSGETECDRPYIPLFISLRNIDFQTAQESSQLMDAIRQQWQSLGMAFEQLEILLQQENLLLLLDGFDEVAQIHRGELHLQIQQLATVYPQTPMVMTCRLGIEDYHFRGFTLMEMADFGWPQIELFVQRWFTAQSAPVALAQEKAKQFLEQLQLQHHQPIRELAGTPILLHLLCLVFTERGTFPKKRSRLYQNGLDILLSRWDNARGIQRDLVYGNLSLSDRINILSQIATTFFEQGKQFFEKNEAVPIIMDYLATLPNSSTDPETLWLQSEEVLRAIVLHHGLFVEQARDIYSFSHLTFQEYLTARKIFTSAITRNAALKTVTSIATNLFVPPIHPLQHLAARVLDIRWREVIALTVELLPNADSLLQLMQQRIDSWIDRVVTEIRANSDRLVTGALQVGSTAADIGTGFFIVLFSTFFMLSGGDRIWAWVVRLFPRTARSRVNGAGVRAWATLTAYVRATVIVAVVDGAGVGIAAAVLGVPLALPLGVLVFLGAFVPIVGALVTGIVAVLVALVAKGPVVALVMLGAVIAVQQLEAHVLQPFLMGRAVSVHPLAVILSIAAGVLLAGIVGGLFAVPIAAVVNVVAKYLSGEDDEEDARRDAADGVLDGVAGPGSDGPEAVQQARDDVRDAAEEAGPLADEPTQGAQRAAREAGDR